MERGAETRLGIVKTKYNLTCNSITSAPTHDAISKPGGRDGPGWAVVNGGAVVSGNVVGEEAK